MSGREFEPVAAFFPSIDRSVLRDLDRQLRTAPSPEPPSPVGQQQPLERPDISGVVEAIENAGSSLSAMAVQIQELQANAAKTEAMTARLRQKLGEATQKNLGLEANLKVEAERADEATALATEHAARADALEQELALALTDLNRVTDAINTALGLSHPSR